MPILPPKLEVPLHSQQLPAPIMFRSAFVPAQGLYPQHQHAWGEFVYAFSGVMEVKVADHHYLAPPHYGIWLPPDVEHVGLNRYEAYINPEFRQARRLASMSGFVREGLMRRHENGQDRELWALA